MLRNTTDLVPSFAPSFRTEMSPVRPELDALPAAAPSPAASPADADAFVHARGAALRPTGIPAQLQSLLASSETQSAPRPSAAADGNGYPTTLRGGDVLASQRAALGQLAKVQGQLSHVRDAYHAWKKENPKAAEPTDGKYTIGEIVDGDMSVRDQCLHLLLLVLHERPETVSELQQAAPSAPSAPETAPQAPAAPAADASQNPLSGLMQALGPICQVVGPIASILGGVLSSPLGPVILGGACTALGAVFPPALALAPAAATIAPVAGAVLMGVGGVATGAGALAGKSSSQPQPAVPVPGAPGAAPDLSGALNGLVGLFNAVGPVVSSVASSGAVAV